MDIKQKLDPSIDYSARQLTNSSLTHMKLVPLSGNQTTTTSPSSGTDVTFEIPVQGVNLAESYFSCQVSIPAQGSGNYAWAHKGIVPWNSVQLYTRGGQYLLNIQERATDYSRIVGSCDTTDEELQHGDELGGIYQSNDSKSLLGGEGAAGSTAKPYWEQKYLEVGGDNAALVFNIKYPMKYLKGTIFEVNKSVLFREVLVLKLKMASGADIAYLGTSATNPDTGAATITGNITYSNVAFYCAQERNAAIVEGLSAQTSSDSGFTLFCPYPSTFTNSRSGTDQNVTLRLNKSHGSSIKSIKNCVFGNTANNLRYDRDTAGGTKVISYYTNLNNNRLTEFDVSIANNDDWMLHRQRFKDSPVYNRTIYRQNWVHVDGFENNASKNEDGEEDTNCFGGLSTDQEVRYDAYFTTNNATHRHFTIVHAQKVLNINNRGIVFA